MKRVAAIVVGVVAFAVACAGGQISTKNAPPNIGSLTTASAGARLVVLYYGGGGGTGPNWVVKTFDPATNKWKTQPKDAFPNPPVLIGRSTPALFGTGSLAVVMNEGQSGVYDGVADRWSLIPGPGIGERTAVMVLGDWLLAHERADGGPEVRNAALFDPDARRWSRIAGGPAGPQPRLAPILFVRDTLVVLPGSDNSIRADYPGAFWRVGSPAWQEMSSQGMPDARGYDWSQAVAADAGGVLLVRVAGTWARFDPAQNAWSAVHPAGAPATSAQVFAVGTAGQVLIAGAPDAALYDPKRDRWTAAPLGTLLGGRALYRWDATRFVLADPGRKQAFLYNAAQPALAPAPLDASSLPAERSYRIRRWTGRCLLVWGAVQHHADPDSCRGADRPCDPASTVEYETTGSLWCPEVKEPSRGEKP